MVGRREETDVDERRRSGTGPSGTRRAVGALLTAAVVTTFLAGCTSPDDPGPSVQDGAGGAEARPGPLDALLAAVSEGVGETPEAQVVRLERNEELIAACMAEQGFEYLPMDVRAQARAQGGGRLGGTSVAGPADDPVAHAQEQGYGVFSADALAEALAPPGPGAGDPNAERLAAMSPTEQEAWYLALWGPGQDESGLEPYDWTKYGCGGYAAHESGGDQLAVFDDSPWQDLREQITALAGSVAVHPDLVDGQVAWSECMADAGYPGYATVDEPAEEMGRLAEQVWTETGQGVPVGADGADGADGAAPAADGLAARWAEMRQVETQLAVADQRCRADSGYEDLAAQVWLDLQEEFYAAHRTELDAWLAAYEEFQAAQA